MSGGARRGQTPWQTVGPFFHYAMPWRGGADLVGGADIGWQAEAPALATLFELAAGALAALRPVIEGLEVDTAAMARNLAAANVGHDVGHAAELTRQALAERRRD